MLIWAALETIWISFLRKDTCCKLYQLNGDWEPGRHGRLLVRPRVQSVESLAAARLKKEIRTVKASPREFFQPLIHWPKFEPSGRSWSSFLMPATTKATVEEANLFCFSYSLDIWKSLSLVVSCAFRPWWWGGQSFQRWAGIGLMILRKVQTSSVGVANRSRVCSVCS
jgi:hypothetical protein